jgi:hypothetical protein
LAKVLRQVVRRAAVLLELGAFGPGASLNVQASITVEISHLEHSRKIARLNVPEHAAGIFVTCPLLNNRPVTLRSVPDIQAKVGIQVPDQVARGTLADAAQPTAIEPPLVIEIHLALRLELVVLDWSINAAGLDHARAASALLDGQAGRIAGAASRLETLGAPGIDQRHMLMVI